MKALALPLAALIVLAGCGNDDTVEGSEVTPVVAAFETAPLPPIASCVSSTGHAACADFDEDAGPLPAPFVAGSFEPGGFCSLSTAQAKSGATSLLCQASSIDYDAQGATSLTLAFDAFLPTKAADIPSIFDFARISTFQPANASTADSVSQTVTLTVDYEAAAAGKIIFATANANSATASNQGGGVAYSASPQTIDTGLVASSGWHHYELSVSKDAQGNLVVNASADGKTVFANQLKYGDPAATGFSAEVGTFGYIDNVTIN